MHVWRDIYSVGDRKQECVRERNVDGETTDRYRDGDVARGTSASLGVGDDRRVVQRLKLCVCERKIKRGHLTACREKHI